MSGHFSSLQTEQHSHPVVLLVDDSPTLLLQMRKMLEQAGFIVAEATSGAETLALFSQLKPDFVLLDVMMPGMDGFETCARLRQLPHGSRTPVVMVTSLDDIHSINRAYEVGATDFVTKPINAVILKHRVRYMMRAGRTLQERDRNEEVLQQTQAELERHVADRTAELEQSTKQLQQEVRERQRAEEELRDAHAHLSFLIENLPLAVIEWDAQMRVRRWSPQAEQMFGWSAQEVLGKHFHEWRFIPQEEVNAVDHSVASLQAGDTPRHVSHNRNYRKDGVIIECEWYNSVLRDTSGIVESVLSLIQDVTKRQEAERLKDELISTVSHELRTPLTSLRGFAELMLKRQFPPDKQRKFLTVIHGEALRLTNLINDFLDLQRIESGRQTYDFAVLDLGALLQQSITVFSGSQSPHTFRLHIPTGFPPVRGDRDRLQQVFANLVSNAIKFSPEGGVITLGAEEQEGAALLWVSDQGIGIPAEAVPNLFSKFFRVDNQETRRIGGTGLGLALVKKIIEAHQGRIWVESTQGQGSTFFFTLPLAQAITHDTVMIA